jgi:hypothetical protein
MSNLAPPGAEGAAAAPGGTIGSTPAAQPPAATAAPGA